MRASVLGELSSAAGAATSVIPNVGVVEAGTRARGEARVSTGFGAERCQGRWLGICVVCVIGVCAPFFPSLGMFEAMPHFVLLLSSDRSALVQMCCEGIWGDVAR